MNGSSLRSRIQDERANDPRFRRGYQLCSELAIALIVIRLLSPAMGWFTSHIVPDFMALRRLAVYPHRRGDDVRGLGECRG